jgi:hypothetical protein
LTFGDMSAPFNALVGSASARAVATAKRKTEPMVARRRFAVSQTIRLQGHALGRLDTPKGANPLFYLMFRDG